MINRNEDTERDTKRELFVCHELLKIWEKSMERVSKLQRTSATDLKSILENVLVTVELIFQHCRGRYWALYWRQIGIKLSSNYLNIIRYLDRSWIEENFFFFFHSKKLYGVLFDKVSEELTNLFRKAKTILNLFLATLDGVIAFDTDTESELLVKGERSYYVLTIL